MERFEAEIAALKRTLAERAIEYEQLQQRCSRMQKFFALRPDEMRRFGELELTEIISREERAARSETLLKQRERELEDRQQQRERELLERERSIEERALAQREVTQRAFSEERAALAQDLERWQRKAEEALAQVAAAKKDQSLSAENAARAEAERAAAEQKLRISDLEKRALESQLQEWERKAAELKQRVGELDARADLVRRSEDLLRQRAEALDERERDLEKDFSERRAGMDKLKQQMQGEISQLTRHYRAKDVS